MKQRWSIPIGVALFALALVILFSQGAGLAQGPDASLVVTKSVSPTVIAPGRSVLYSVSLENISEEALEISSLVDTLPVNFEYVGLAPGSEWNEEPSDKVAPEIRWSGPIPVAAGDIVMLQYYVFVPGSVTVSSDPYTNTIVATVGTEESSGQAGLSVSIGDILVTKSADPNPVEPGQPVTYTVTFENSGYAARTLEVISDTMAPELTFEGMTDDSDVTANPVPDAGGTAVWSGAFPVESQSQFVVKYVATAPMVDEALTMPNTAWGRLDDGTVVGPAEESVTVSSGPTTVWLPFIARNWAPAAFTVTKTADPTQAFAEAPGALIAYTVEFTNVGTDPGELGDIRDTLPAGFTFVRMLPGSDVMANPSGTTGTIVWDGPFPVAGKTSLTLMYEVQATTTVGTYVNSVSATVTEGKPPDGPATATVDIVEPILLSEEFQNPSAYWQPFLNYWRLNEAQWYYRPGVSDDGSTVLGHTWWYGVSNPDNGAHDALYMYKDPAAEQWTNYSYQARVYLGHTDDRNRGQIGLWFRGKHQEHEDNGQWVAGYYFVIKPAPNRYAWLMQMRTEDECGDDCTHNYNFSNPIELAELTGSELVARGVSLDLGRWHTMRVEVDGPQIRCYVDGKLLFDYYDNIGTTFTEGTVGFVTYIAGDARFDHVLVEPLR